MPATPDIEVDDPDVSDETDASSEASAASQAPEQSQAPWLKYQSKAADTGPWMKYRKPKAVPVSEFEVSPPMTEPTTGSAVLPPPPAPGTTPVDKLNQGVAAAENFIGEGATGAANLLVQPFNAAQGLFTAGMNKLTGQKVVVPPIEFKKDEPMVPAFVPKMAGAATSALTEALEGGYGPTPSSEAAGRFVEKNVSGLTTPGAVATYPLLEARIGRGAMATLMAAHVPAQLEETERVLRDPKATRAEKIEAVADATLAVGMPVGLAASLGGPKSPPGGPPARPQAELPPNLAAVQEPLPRTAAAAKQAVLEQGGTLNPPINETRPPEQPTTTEVPNASGEQKTTEIHGGLRTQPIVNEGKVPQPPGERGVQPQAGGGLPEEANPPGAQPAPREVEVSQHEADHKEYQSLKEQLAGLTVEQRFSSDIPKRINDIMNRYGGFAPPEPIPGLRFDHAMPGAEGKKLWQFTVQDNGPAHNASFTVPAGSPADVIQAKWDAKHDQFNVPKPDWSVTVQGAQGEVPGYVQIDDRPASQRGTETGQLGAESRKPPTMESLKAAGHEVPDFSKLPTGKYTWAEAVAKAREIVDQPVKKPAGPSRKIPSYTRPPDVLDALEGTGKINIASARAIREGYNPPAAARKYFDFSNQSSGIDKVLQGVHQSPAGNFTSLADEEALLDAIDKAGPARVGMRGAQAQERKAVKVQQVQDSDFKASVVEGKGTTNPPEKLGNVVKKPGETFMFQGQKFTVASYDEANDEYILDDGRRFGRQKLSGEEMIHPDPTTPKAKPAEMTPEQVYDAALARSREATKAFRVKQEAYRARTIGDEEFLKARADFDAAMKDFDAAEQAFIDAKNKLSPAEKEAAEREAAAASARIAKLFGKPESVEEQAAREAKEQADREAKAAEDAKLDAAAKKEREARERLNSRIGGNLGEAGQGGLFAEPGQVEMFKPPPPKPPDVGPGMGGAVPGEFGTSPTTPTSIKNAKVDEERAKRGLPPAMQPLRRTFGEVWAKAMAHIDSDPAWLYGDKTQPGLIEELRRKPRALTDEEDAALLYHQVDLQNEYGKATRDLAQHFEDGNADMVQQTKLRIAGLSDQLLDLYNIGKTSGTETGRGLNARKMMAYEDFTLAKMELDKRAANGGRRLTDAETAEVARLNEKIEATQRAYDDYTSRANERIAELEVKAALDRVKLEAAGKMDPVIKRIVTRIGDVLHTQRDTGLARIKARMKEGRSSANIDPQEFIDYSIVGASHLFDGALSLADWSAKMVADFGDVIKPHLDTIFAESNKRFDEAVDAAAGKNKPRVAAAKKAVRDPAERAAGLADQIAAKVKAGKRIEITMLVQRLARTFVERGVDDRDELIDKVHGVLSKIDPDMTRREAMDAISGYGSFKQLTKDAISVELRDLKGQMQQVAKLEDMQAGRPPLKTGLERRTPSEEESRLIKAVNEAKREFQIPVDDPDTQLKSSLDTLKTRLRNRTKELQDKLAAGDFAPRARRELKLDSEALRLKALNERAKDEFRRGLVKDRLKQRNPMEKTADVWTKWRRFSLLSGPSTLAKLTSAAIQTLSITPLEEVAGAGFSKLFPALARNAAREGGLSVKAEAKAWTEGFTRGLTDAAQVLKTGSSELDVLYGKDRGYPRDLLDFMGNVHGALKTVPKRAEFARSLQKRAEHAIRNGVDITDPMVQTRLALDAYKDANRSIFLEDNRVVNAYKRFLSAFDQPEKGTGHVPFSSKATGAAFRTLLPIVRVPTNLAARTFEYATGLGSGSAKLAQAYRRGIEQLPPEQADLIMRHLKKGSLGAAVLLLGYFSPNLVGGYYQSGEKRKPGTAKAGTMKVAGVTIPSYLLHNPLLEALQIGATVRHVADSKQKKWDTKSQGLAAGVVAGGLGMTEELPFIRETVETAKAYDPKERSQYFGELGKSLLVPQAVQWIAQHTDKDAQGNIIARKPKTAAQHIEEGIPGLRKNVPRNPKQPSP